MPRDLPDDLEHDHISNYEVSDDYAEKYLRPKQVTDEQVARALHLLYNAARVSPVLREAVQTVENGIERLQRQLRAAKAVSDA